MFSLRFRLIHNLNAILEHDRAERVAVSDAAMQHPLLSLQRATSSTREADPAHDSVSSVVLVICQRPIISCFCSYEL